MADPLSTSSTPDPKAVVVPTLSFPLAVARYVFPVTVSWVVDALPLNCCSALHEFAVVVPKARLMVLVVF
ncbi:MAG: hypothetical protein ACM3TU_00165, partial [Bacillota bacterium]